ncbi:hypothetical protein [Aliikangiella sp. IMCC44359]|uniref:hypothetical protein n=1 Tax=Aliikangiella sp. IMCC44359 TaxID=3459125 RepID=UPI00403A9E61
MKKNTKKSYYPIALIALILTSFNFYAFSDNSSLVLSPTELKIEIEKAEQLNIIPQTTNHQLLKSQQITQQINNQTHLSITGREYLNMKLVSLLKVQLTNEQLIILQQLANEVAQIKTTLNDGNHQQIITAFPYPEAAKAKLKQHSHYLKSVKLLTQITQADYPALALNNEFLNAGDDQLKIFSFIEKKLSNSESKSLLDWSFSKSEINNEIKLALAINTQQNAQIVKILEQDKNLTLHHHLYSITKSWPPEQLFLLLKEITNIKSYTSLAINQIEQLDIAQSQQQQFFLKQLSNPYSGSSAAQALAKNMTPQLVDQIINIAINQQSDLIMKNSVLALSLQPNDYSKNKLRELLQQNKLKPAIAQELTSWLN